MTIKERMSEILANSFNKFDEFSKADIYKIGDDLTRFLKFKSVIYSYSSDEFELCLIRKSGDEVDYKKCNYFYIFRGFKIELDFTPFNDFEMECLKIAIDDYFNQPFTL